MMGKLLRRLVQPCIVRLGRRLAASGKTPQERSVVFAPLICCQIKKNRRFPDARKTMFYAFRRLFSMFLTCFSLVSQACPIKTIENNA